MEKKIRPLNRSITIACAAVFLLLSIILSVATYRIFSASMYSRYQEQGHRGYPEGNGGRFL
ncbi:MAG: hypothetical protein E7474_09565 [Ruminococcaceae bacterium]|nr:hypothetical protein [Oscillospiraceae bacterium]